MKTKILLVLIYFFLCQILFAGKYNDFELEKVSGGKLKLSSIIGEKIVLLSFGATWCPYCIKEIPQLKTLNSKYKNKGLEIISINIREPENIVKQLIEKKEIDYTVLLDNTGKVAQQYKVRGIPSVFLINLKGEIVFSDHILPSEDIIIKQLNEIKKTGSKTKHTLPKTKKTKIK